MTAFLNERGGVQVPVSPDDPLPTRAYGPGGVPLIADAGSVSDTVDALDTWSEALSLAPGQRASISIEGTFDATVLLQRRFDGGNWNSVALPDGSPGWVAAAQSSYEADETTEIRLGIDDDYTSGAADVRLGKG